MRKNSARKWLHFTLDLLPVIAIPVFMIYSHRHSLTDRTNVEINYKYETNEVVNNTDLVEGNIYHFDIDNQTLDYFMQYDDSYIFMQFVHFDNYDFSALDVTLDEFIVSSSGVGVPTVYISFEGQEVGGLFIYLTDGDYTFSYYLSPLNDDFTFSLCGDFVFIEGHDFIVFDGDEHWYITSSTYNEIESVNADTTNENILNVFYKDFTDTIDNYFNFDNVFTFGDIWQWFNTNMFGGNASPIAHAIYEIIVYEFIIDIMFLSYAVFMFIIDFTTDTLERFTGWSSRG